MYSLLFVLYIISHVSSQHNSINYCYKNARDEFNIVLKLYNNPPNFLAPDEFKDITNLSNRIKFINLKRKPNELQKKMNQIKNNLKKAESELKLVKEGNNLFKQIKGDVKKLKKDENFGNKTQDECSMANKKYAKLSKDFQVLEKQDTKFKETIGEYSLKINEINEKSLEIKQEVNEVKIPSYLSEKYMRDKNVFKSFKDILTVAKEIKILLEKIRNKIKLDLKAIKNKLKTNKLDGLPDIAVKKKQLIKDIHFFKDYYNEVSRLLELIDIKNKAKIDLDDIKKIAFHLCKNGVCEIKKAVPVEL